MAHHAYVRDGLHAPGVDRVVDAGDGMVRAHSRLYVDEREAALKGRRTERNPIVNRGRPDAGGIIARDAPRGAFHGDAEGGLSLDHVERLAVVRPATSGFEKIVHLELNPGLVGTFPTLGLFGRMWTHYRFLDLTLEYVPNSTQGASHIGGSIMMAYFDRADDMREIDESLGSAVSSHNVTAPITGSCRLPIPLDDMWRYTRVAPVSEEGLEHYDIGRVQVAVRGVPPVGGVGTLYFSYRVEFTVWDPKMPPLPVDVREIRVPVTVPQYLITHRPIGNGDGTSLTMVSYGAYDPNDAMAHWTGIYVPHGESTWSAVNSLGGAAADWRTNGVLFPYTELLPVGKGWLTHEDVNGLNVASGEPAFNALQSTNQYVTFPQQTTSAGGVTPTIGLQIASWTASPGIRLGLTQRGNGFEVIIPRVDEALTLQTNAATWCFEMQYIVNLKSGSAGTELPGSQRWNGFINPGILTVLAETPTIQIYDDIGNVSVDYRSAAMTTLVTMFKQRPIGMSWAPFTTSFQEGALRVFYCRVLVRTFATKDISSAHAADRFSVYFAGSTFQTGPDFGVSAVSWSLKPVTGGLPV